MRHYNYSYGKCLAARNEDSATKICITSPLLLLNAASILLFTSGLKDFLPKTVTIMYNNDFGIKQKQWKPLEHDFLNVVSLLHWMKYLCFYAVSSLFMRRGSDGLFKDLDKYHSRPCPGNNVYFQMIAPFSICRRYDGLDEKWTQHLLKYIYFFRSLKILK